MATFKKYVGQDDYYVHDAFRTKGRLYNVTYQIKPKGLRKLLDRNIRNGGKIPDSLFKKLKNSGDLYTAKTGVDGVDDKSIGKKSLFSQFVVNRPPPARPPSVIQNFRNNEIPGHLKSVGEIRRFLKTKFPNLTNSKIKPLISAALESRKALNPSEPKNDENKTLRELLKGRILTEIQDRKNCIMIFCQPPHL